MSDRSDIRTYAQLTNERTKEKTMFLEFVKSEFFKRNINNCHNLQPELNKFITKRWKDSIKNALTLNDNHYHLQSAIPLNQSIDNDEFIIEFEKTVEEIGTVLAVNRNKYQSNAMQLSCPFLEYFFPSDVEVVISRGEFSSTESYDVVISLTTLTSILSYAKDISIDWNVTFSLKKDDKKKVIVFDEILPQSSLGCLEKNRKAYKYGVTTAIVVPKKNEIFSFKENGFLKREPPIYDKSTTSILSCEPVSTYKACRFEEYLKKCADSISKVTQTADTNRIRRVWNIKRKNVDYCRLIIDSSQDFCEKQADGSAQFINLSPKIDYQCEFGAEQMSLLELISEWCELRFGPKTITDRGKF